MWACVRGCKASLDGQRKQQTGIACGLTMSELFGFLDEDIAGLKQGSNVGSGNIGQAECEMLHTGLRPQILWVVMHRHDPACTLPTPLLRQAHASSCTWVPCSLDAVTVIEPPSLIWTSACRAVGLEAAAGWVGSVTSLSHSFCRSISCCCWLTARHMTCCIRAASGRTWLHLQALLCIAYRLMFSSCSRSCASAESQPPRYRRPGTIAAGNLYSSLKVAWQIRRVRAR